MGGITNDYGHLAPGIRQVITAFEGGDFTTLQGVFGDHGLQILKRWWRGEELGLVYLVGDIRSSGGLLGAEPTLRQARCIHLDHTTRVLDIACGIGGPGRILARHFKCRIHGIDIDEDSIIIVRGLSKLEGLEALATFQVGDRASLPVEDTSYDVVWGAGGWGDGEDRRKTWAEACRVLRQSGQVVCSGCDRTMLPWIEALGFGDLRFHSYYGKVRKRTLELFLKAMEDRREQILKQAGQAIWESFYNQKTKQLADLDEQALGVVVAIKR